MSAAASALARALREDGMVVEDWASYPWASVGAGGQRHRFEIRLPEDAAEAMLDGLSEREFALEGQFVADIAAVAIDRQGCEARLVIEALTIALD